MEGISDNAVIAYRVISITCAIISLLCAIFGLLICFTQSDWKKRDGVLRFGIFAVDIMFSCVVTVINILGRSSLVDGNKSGVIVACIFLFVFLLSWAIQCFIAIYRYIVIISPFMYTKTLNRYRLNTLVYSTCIFTVIACVLSCILTEPSQLRDDVIYFEYQMILLHSSKTVIKVFLALHTILLLVILAMECYLCKIALGHQRRYRSITNSVSSKDGSCNVATQTIVTNPTEIQSNRRFSATRTLQKHFNFTSSQKMTVRRTPFLILGVHFVTIILYITIGFLYVIDDSIDTNSIFLSKYYRNTCMFLLVLNSIRPTINLFSHITMSKLRRLKLFFQKLVEGESAELCTDYYIENQKEIKTLFKLRRESAHSLVNEASVV